MNSSDFRREARNRLSGKWGKAIILILAFSVIDIILTIIERKVSSTARSILYFVELLLNVPLSFGLIISLLKLYNNEEAYAFDYLNTGFSNFTKAWGISLRIILKLILPIILIIVSAVMLIFGGIGLFYGKSILTNLSSFVTSTEVTFSVLAVLGLLLYYFSIIWLIVKSYYYQLSFAIAADNPELSSKDAVEKSKELMTGNRGKLFILQLSFIGWIFLACFTLGIGFLWIIPYMQFAHFAFYKYLNGNTFNVKEESKDEPIR